MLVAHTIGVLIVAVARLGRLQRPRTSWRADRVARAVQILAVISFAATGITCGGSDSAGERTPTAPSPPPSLPAANIQFEGDGQLMGCVRSGTTTNVRCDFQETGKNTGPGCASRLRVTVRLIAGESDVAAESVSPLGSRILRPDEQFVYEIRFVATPELFASVTGYRPRAEWTNTPC